MKIKINVLAVTAVLTIIVFGISTYLQKKMIKYEPKISCLILSEDILENEPVKQEMFKKSEVPISIVGNQKIVTSFEEIEGLYATDNMKKSQIAVRSQFDTKENLFIYEAEDGKEKISIKIKNPENGISFQLKEKELVNVYVTIRNDLASSFVSDMEQLTIGDAYDGYTVFKLLETVEILGVFNNEGQEYEKGDSDSVDCILISVEPEKAKMINLFREIGTFNITGVNRKMENNTMNETILTSGEN